MAIVDTDIKLYKAGQLNLGGAISGTEIAGGVANNVFDDVASAEASAGDIEYRAFYVKNTHGSLTLQNAVVWISVLSTSPDTEIDLAMADEAIDATVETIADESTAPSGPAFSRPTSKVAGLVVGNLGPGSYRAVWIRRTVTAGAAATADSASIRVDGDTAA